MTKVVHALYINWTLLLLYVHKYILHYFTTVINVLYMTKFVHVLYMYEGNGFPFEKNIIRYSFLSIPFQACF